MERAHHAYLAVGEAALATRCAFWIGFVYGTRGELGPAAGWAERATRVLGDLDCVEQGYLLLPGLMMSAMGGDWQSTHDVACAAESVGEAYGDGDLTTLARHWRGRAAGLPTIAGIDDAARDRMGRASPP